MAKIYVKNSFHFFVWENGGMGKKFFFNQIRSLKIASSLVTGRSPVAPEVDQRTHHVILHCRVHFGEGRQGGAGIYMGKIRKKSKKFEKAQNVVVIFLFHYNFSKNDSNYALMISFDSPKSTLSSDIKRIFCSKKRPSYGQKGKGTGFSWPACLFWP